MEQLLHALEKVLRRAGYSTTVARKKVFLALFDQSPRTMAEIIKALPDVDRASVYRTISLFETLNVIEKIQIGWKYKIELAGEFGRHHHHMTCVRCGRMVPLHANRRIEEDIEKMARHKGFAMTSHQLEIRGICKDCTIIEV